MMMQYCEGRKKQGTRTMTGIYRSHAMPLPAALLKPLIVFVLALLAAVFAASEVLASKRVALVIGNSAYVNASELANPANDASDLAIALNDLGFEVTVGVDLDNRSMRQKVREFSSSLRGADVAMLFYAGHAVQVNGRNYLAPVDTQLQFESDVDFETIPLEFIQEQMEREAETILLFLDACRDNPLTRSLKVASRSNGAGKGLAEEKLSTSGIMIAFATNPGNVALDGKGRNSPFTKAMLDNIRRPGVEISTLMTDVRVQVVKDTDGQQTPWINSALLGRFYFNPDDNENSQETDTTGTQKTASLDDEALPRTGSSAGVENARIEALAWDAVKDSDNVEELETYLAVYGNGFYAKLAKIRIERLKGGKEEGDDSGEAVASVDTPEVSGKAAQSESQTASIEKQAPAESARSTKATFDEAEVARDIQQKLAQLECNPGRPDGIWGKRSQSALDKFVRASGVKLVSARPEPALLNQLREYSGAGCPKPVIVNKTCPAGQRLSRKGNCFTPRSQQASAPPASVTRSVGQPPQDEEFFDDGQQVIIHEPAHQQPPMVMHPQQPQHQQPPMVMHPQPEYGQPAQPNIGGAIVRGVIGAGIACVLGGC
jgi:hypothetical protein